MNAISPFHWVKILAVLALAVVGGHPVQAQASLQAMPAMPAKYDAGHLRENLHSLQTLGSLLYIAAHPDDENTRFLAWAAREKGYHTAYLSLTRGGGGQNLLGEERGTALGVLRTQELLQARRKDGAVQFFSRANDFGYSKLPEETFHFWKRRQVLADMVWVIRRFRPDVMVTRFSPYRAGKTHGHHTASAILAMEAFKAAADTSRFPEQLAYVEPWRPKKMFWNTSWWFYGTRDYDKTDHVAVNVGAYNPWLGKSYNEIGAEARTQHKSQGFGAAPSRGALAEFFDPLSGDIFDTTALFANIETRWRRLEGGLSIEKKLREAEAAYDPAQPEASIPRLIEVYRAIEALPATPWKRIQQNRLAATIAQCAGLYAEWKTGAHYGAPGDTIDSRFAALVRRPYPVQLQQLVTGSEARLEAPEALVFNRLIEKSLPQPVPEAQAISQPYWLIQPVEDGMFVVEDQRRIGRPENEPPFEAHARFRFGEKPQESLELDFRLPLEYAGTDPVEGELRHTFQVAPPVWATLGMNKLIFTGKSAQSLSLRLERSAGPARGLCRLSAGEGWRVRPKRFDFRLEGDRAQLDTVLEVRPRTDEEGRGELRVSLEVEGRTYTQSVQTVDYRHIPRQYLFPQAKAQLLRMSIQRGGRRIGYLAGAGDEVPEALRAVGYDVTLLSEDDVRAQNLAGFDAVVTGVRFFNVHDNPEPLQAELLAYCKQGGTLVYQYSKSYNLKTQNIGPYPLEVSRDRVTVEKAEVEMLVPQHPILQSPNAISEADFEGWVQERGLYFPGQWDDAYTPLLEMHDPGEEKTRGALLAASYGEGAFIYTGLSFFRQLPAGVPGAYRLMANMLAYNGRQP
jgi:LmbE family N-acetylglucosaminyl deacetylase